MKASTEIGSSYTIIDLDSDWIYHQLLLKDSSVVKFVNSPKIYPFPFNISFILGTYFYDGNLILVLSLNNYFRPSNFSEREIENLLIVKSSDGFIFALCNINRVGSIAIQELEYNSEFHGNLTSIYTSNQIVTEEYGIKSNKSRGFLVDLDRLKQETIDEIRHYNSELLNQIFSLSSTIVTSPSNLTFDQSIENNIINKIDNTGVSNTNSYVLFKVDKQDYAISTSFLLTIPTTIPFPTSTNPKYDYYLGVIKTLFGSANVFDLRSYFGSIRSENSSYMLIRGNDQIVLLIVDKVIDIVEIQQYQILSNLYPISGNSDSFYSGIYLDTDPNYTNLTYILSLEQLVKALYSNKSIVLGIHSNYVFEHVNQTILESINDIENLIFWVGESIRIGFEVGSIKFIEPYSGNDDINKFTSLDHPILGELPILNLNLHYQIPKSGNNNLIILQIENDYLGLLFSGEVSLLDIPKRGNLDNINLDALIFDMDDHFIQDFAIYGNFFGYLLSSELIFKFFEMNNRSLCRFISNEVIREKIEYVVIKSNDNSYCFPLKELDHLQPSVEEDIFDLDMFIEGKSMKFKKYNKQICIKLKHNPQYYTTTGDIDIQDFYVQDIEKIIADNPKQPMVSLPNGTQVRIVSLKEAL